MKLFSFLVELISNLSDDDSTVMLHIITNKALGKSLHRRYLSKVIECYSDIKLFSEISKQLAQTNHNVAKCSSHTFATLVYFLCF